GELLCARVLAARIGLDEHEVFVFDGAKIKLVIYQPGKRDGPTTQRELVAEGRKLLMGQLHVPRRIEDRPKSRQRSLPVHSVSGRVVDELESIGEQRIQRAGISGRERPVETRADRRGVVRAHVADDRQWGTRYLRAGLSPAD